MVTSTADRTRKSCEAFLSNSTAFALGPEACTNSAQDHLLRVQKVLSFLTLFPFLSRVTIVTSVVIDS